MVVSFLPGGSGYRDLWQSISSGRRDQKDPILDLDSFVLSAPDGFLGGEVVVSPVLSDVSAFLGDQLSPSRIWVQRAVARGWC